MTAASAKPTLEGDDALFRLLRQIDVVPGVTQRGLSAALGISLGRVNAQLRAAIDGGLIKVGEREGPDRRQRVAYVLTARGASEKTRLTDSFLARKFAEYDALHAELTGTHSGLSPLKTRTVLMAN